MQFAGKALLFCFHLKKSAAESQRMLSEAYGDYISSISTCEYWVWRYKKDDFDMEDKEHVGQPKKFENEKVKALLDQDPSQTQELTESLNVDRSTIFQTWKPLKAIGMIQKQRNWVPYELKPKDVERHKMTCELLLRRHKRKSFLHRDGWWKIDALR